MKSGVPALITGVLALSGCAGMAQQYLIEDAEIAREGNKMAVLDTCVVRGMAPDGVVADYRRAQQQLFSVSVHNRALYEMRYAAYRDIAGAKPADSLRPMCAMARAGLPEATLAMQRQYVEASGARGAANGRREGASNETFDGRAIGQVTALQTGTWAPRD